MGKHWLLVEVRHFAIHSRLGWPRWGCKRELVSTVHVVFEIPMGCINRSSWQWDIWVWRQRSTPYRNHCSGTNGWGPRGREFSTEGKSKFSSNQHHGHWTPRMWKITGLEILTCTSQSPGLKWVYYVVGELRNNIWRMKTCKIETTAWFSPGRDFLEPGRKPIQWITEIKSQRTH